MDPVQILFDKYKLLKQEVFQYISHYKSQINHLQVFASITIALVPVAFRTDVVANEHNWFLWLIGALLLVTLANYIVMNIADSIYHLVLLGQRMLVLERQINAEQERELLLWETRVVPQFYDPTWPVDWVLNPNVPLSIYSLVLMFGACVLPAYGIYQVWCLLIPVAKCSAVIVGIFAAFFVVMSAFTLARINKGMRRPVGVVMKGWENEKPRL